MTRGTIVGDGLPVSTGVAAVVAAKATRRIVVPKIIGMASPSQTHVGKDVPEVDGRYFLARLLHQRASGLIEGRVIRPIEIVDFVPDTLLRDVAGGVVHLQNLDRLLPDVRKIWTDTSERHLLVHRIFGQFEDMSGPVVAIHTIHHTMFALI